MDITNLTVDEFIELKDSVEEIVTAELQSNGTDAYCEVDDDTNDPNRYVVNGRLVLTITIEPN